MTTRAELRARWLAWLNGAIHAVTDALIFGGAGAAGALTGTISWDTAGLILLTAVAAGLRGYYTDNRPPDIFALDKSVPPQTTTVVTTTEVTASQPPATDEVHTMERGFITVAGLAVLVAILLAVLCLAGFIPLLWLAVSLGVLALLVLLAGPNRRL